MKPEWCEQEIWDQSVKLANSDNAWYDQRELIALALHDAHQRGRREGMEEAAKIARKMLVYADTTSEADIAIPAAIRAKAQEVKT